MRSGKRPWGGPPCPPERSGGGDGARPRVGAENMILRSLRSSVVNLRIALVVVALSGCDGAVEEGAAAYQVGEYDRAVSLWEPIRETGNASGVLLYDLGNAFWRKGDAARAIACWRAARQLRPRDGAISHNLALVRSLIEGVPEPVGEASPWLEVVTPGELGLFGTIALAAASAGAVWRRRAGYDPEKTLTWVTPWAVLAVFGLLLGGLGVVGWQAQRNEPVAVVVDTDAVVRDAAREDAGDGRRGWVAEGVLQIASP